MATKFGRGGLLVVLFATTVAVVWWFVHPTATSIASANRRANAEAAPEPALPAPVSADPVQRTEEERPAGDAAPAPPRSDQDDPLLRWFRDPEQGDLVEGTVTVVDANGQEHAQEDGSFTPIALRKEDGGGNSNQPVPVQAGRFRIHLPPGRDLGVTALVLGSRDAFIPQQRPKSVDSVDGVSSIGERGSVRFPVVAGQPIHVKAQWARLVRVHVVDPRTHSELRNVDALLARNSGRVYDTTHPGSLDKAEKLVDHGDSPLELAGPRPGSNLQWRDTVWIHAPACSWARVGVDFEKGGEKTVELVPGASLEITIISEIPPAPPVQRVSYDADESVAELRLLDESTYKIVVELPPKIPGPTLVEGLPIGRFPLSLERGRYWDHPLVLGKTTVELTAETTAHATLIITAPREPRRVPLAGTIHIAPDWNCTFLDLRFEPVDVKDGTSLEQRGLELKDLEPVADVPGLHRFKLLPVLPGRYLVNSYTFSFQQLVDTGPEGRTDLALVIGDPVDVFVKLVDALNDRPLGEGEAQLLLWNCRWPPETRGGGLMTAKWDAARAAYRIKAPTGEIELHVGWHEPGRFDPIDPSFFTLHEGVNELTVRVRRSTDLLLTFEVDNARIDNPPGMRAHVEAPDGSALEKSELLEPIRRRDGITLRVPAAGPWRVVVEPPAGFEAVAPLEVTVASGELAARTVVLKRVK